MIKIVGNNRILWFKKNNVLFIDALFVFCICGIISVLLDVDHIVAYFIGIKGNDMRIAHQTVGYISGIVLCVVLPLIYRQVHRMVLRDKNDVKQKCEKCNGELFYLEEKEDRILTKCNKCNNIHVECLI